MSDKALPADINAERATLGSILLDREAIIPIAPWMEAEYFYNEKHGWIYDAQLACYNRRIPPDLINVSDELRRQERLDMVGGVAYLIELSNSVPTAVHIEYYGRIVERTALMRRLIVAGAKIAALGYRENDEIDDTLGQAEHLVQQVRQRQAQNGFVTAGDAIDALYTQVEQAHERGGNLAGVATGYTDLDHITSGLQKGDLAILAARPAVGKTSLALGIGHNVAQRGQRVAFVSLEMPREQVMARLIAMDSQTDVQALLSGRVSPTEPSLIDSFGRMSQLPLMINDASDMPVMTLRSQLRAAAAIEPIELVIVDYLQLLSGRGDSREQAVAFISRQLKAIAMELKTPVLALSQMSREIEKRTSHAPALSDLRESGGIEQDASVVMFIHREELYDPDTDKKGLAEIHVAKNRNGPIGIASLRFFKSTTKFANLETFRQPEGYGPPAAAPRGFGFG